MSVLPTLEAEYIITGKAKLELRPIAFLGKNSGLAAQAAECANEQGGFWGFHDVLYTNQGGGLGDLWVSWLILAAWVVAGFGISMRLFRWQ